MELKVQEPEHIKIKRICKRFTSDIRSKSGLL